MNLSTKYNPAEVEEKWYQVWLDNKCFHSEPNPERESYTIVIPPPNVTGMLHMGHMLNNTIQDVLIRKARMGKKEALWLPGTDHASIATEAKVVGMLREKGISKHDLTRDEFLDYAWKWRERYGGIILEQLKKLGASCDWDRTAFTMDPDYYKAVIRVFVDLYRKGYIYRGLRMINWDCQAKTALSNEEVVYKEEGEQSALYSIRYKIKGEPDRYLTVATVRPETILGDTAIAVHPEDERYKELIGKYALVPFIDREIPIIADDYVDTSFGTGCLKVTPAHDPNDYEIGLRHNLPVIDTINDDGTLNKKCEVDKYVGKDRFEVRKLIIQDLETDSYLTGTEEFVTRIGRSERTGSIVEPKLSLQWFIKMKEISRRALKAVVDDEVVIYPAKFKNTYRHWMENVRDWCISRQLWWGHRIPAYYYGKGEDDYVVAESDEEALKLAREETGRDLDREDLSQDPDVLDTWASSWLWPIQTFSGFDDAYFDKEKGKINQQANRELNYYYPTQVLVTAPEILFFWVARMIIAGYEYMDEKPFRDVYLTGIVRDKRRRKMSKSLGNSPDPLELIGNYGADGVRTGMLFSSPAGNDLLFDVKLCEQGRNFANKTWNASRLISSWQVNPNLDATGHHEIAVEWFESVFNKALDQVEDHFAKYRISDALMTIYKLIWDDFASWYLEIIKPDFQKPIDKATYDATLNYFENLMKILHPFMPFITEELWHQMRQREPSDCIIVTEWPSEGKINQQLLDNASLAFNVITNIRNIRNTRDIPGKNPLKLHVRTSDKKAFDRFKSIIIKMSNLDEFEFIDKKEEDSAGFIIHGHEFFIPIKGIDTGKERDQIIDELEYTKGFLASVNKKLGNDRFINNAPPEVVKRERKKQADAEARIKALQSALESL